MCDLLTTSALDSLILASVNWRRLLASRAKCAVFRWAQKMYNHLDFLKLEAVLEKPLPLKFWLNVKVQRCSTDEQQRRWTSCVFICSHSPRFKIQKQTLLRREQAASTQEKQLLLSIIAFVVLIITCFLPKMICI